MNIFEGSPNSPAVHTEVREDPLATIPMTQETADELGTRLSEMLDGIAFRPAYDSGDSPGGTFDRHRSYYVGSDPDTTVATIQQSRQTRTSEPTFPSLQLCRKSVLTNITFTQVPDGVVGDKKVIVRRPVYDDHQDLYARYGLTSLLPPAEVEIVMARAAAEVARQSKEQSDRAAVTESQIGLDIFTERDALDLLAGLSGARLPSYEVGVEDMLYVWQRRQEQALAAADESNLLDREVAWLCAIAVRRYADSFIQQTRLQGPGGERELQRIDRITDRIEKGYAAGQHTLAAIFGPLSVEGLIEDGWQHYRGAKGDENEEGDLPFNFSVREIPWVVAMARRNHGDNNVIAIPGENFYGDRQPGYMNVYVRS